MASSRSRRPPFQWIVLGLGAGLALLFAAAFVLVARHGGREGRLGWRPAPAPDGGVLVAGVDLSGPAAGALAPGDRVTAVDGDPRVSWASFGWLIEPLTPGREYALRVARDGRELAMRLSVVSSTRPGWEWTAIVRAVVALLLCTTGLTVGLLRPEQRAARLYSLAVLLSAPIFFANPLLLDMLRSGLLGPGEALVVWLCRVHSPFHGAVGFHFAQEFPRGGHRGRGWRSARVLFYLWAAVVCVLYNVEYYFMIFRPDRAVAFTWQHPLSWRALFALDSLFGPVIFAAIPAVIVLNAREETSPGELRRMRWAFFGALIAFVPVTALFTLRFVQEVLLSGTRLISSGTESVLDNLAFLFLAVAPITLAYAVVKHRVFGIRIVIRRGVRYLLARNVLRAVLLLPLALLTGSVLLNPERTVAQILFEHPLHLVLIAAAALSLRFRGSLARGIDRRFFREAYDEEQVLLSLVDDIRARDSLTDLSRLVSDRLGATLHPERLYLVYRSLEGRDFSLEYSSGGGSSELRIPEDAALVRVMEARAAALELDAEDVALPADEREWLTRLAVRLVVPMLTEGRLVGLILLGDKKSEAPYGLEDRRLLQAVAAQIAILYENTALRRRVAREEQSRREVLSRLARDEINVVKECPQCGTCCDAVVETCPADGAPLVLTIPVERTVDDKYRLERVLGTGGMGSVYEATDLRLGRRVALKILLARNFGNPGALRRFEREAQAAGRLRHPNIVTVHDYGVLGTEGAYLVMELLKGTTLRSELDRVGSLHPPVAADWFDQILDGVAAAHAAGVIHRDLKPDNVIVTRDPQGRDVLKILDFGLAKLSFGEPPDPKSLTRPGTVLGTLRYMSPEQLSGEPTDERSDVFSIGVLVAEALVGRHPFQAPTTAAMVTGILQDPFHVEGDAAELKELDRVLQLCLAKDREDRYPSVAELRRELVPAIRACPPFAGTPRASWDHETIADDASTRRTEG